MQYYESKWNALLNVVPATRKFSEADILVFCDV